MGRQRDAAPKAAQPNLHDTIIDPQPIRLAAPDAPQAADAPDAPAEDEETIPPAGDLAAHEEFFSEGDLARHATDEDELELVANEKAQRKSDPAVVKRRAKLARYVTWAVGVSAALCLVAVVRTAFTSSSASW